NQCSGLSMQWSRRCVPSGNATTPFFTVAVSVPVTRTLPKNQPARDAGLLVWPTMPTLLEKPKTPICVSDVPITPGWSADEPMTRAGGPWGPGGPCLPEMRVTPESAPKATTPGPRPETPTTAGPKRDTPRTPAWVNEKPWTASASLDQPNTPSWVSAIPTTP